MKSVVERSRDYAKDRKTGEATGVLATENSDSMKQYTMYNALVSDDDQSNIDRLDYGEIAEGPIHDDKLYEHWRQRANAIG